MITQIDLVPASKGMFEITVDDRLIYSKKELGRHANPGEVAGLVEDQIGPATFEG